jgi:hypothetical protein
MMVVFLLSRVEEQHPFCFYLSSPPSSSDFMSGKRLLSTSTIYRLASLRTSFLVLFGECNKEGMLALLHKNSSLASSGIVGKKQTHEEIFWL